VGIRGSTAGVWRLQARARESAWAGVCTLQHGPGKPSLADTTREPFGWTAQAIPLRVHRRIPSNCVVNHSVQRTARRTDGQPARGPGGAGQQITRPPLFCGRCGWRTDAPSDDPRGDGIAALILLEYGFADLCLAVSRSFGQFVFASTVGNQTP